MAREFSSDELAERTFFITMVALVTLWWLMGFPAD